MLNKRAHILFEKYDYNIIKKLAKEKGMSVGELIRSAVRKHYFTSKGKLKEEV